MTDTTGARTDFERDGFVLLREYLSPPEADEVSANIQRFVDEVLPGAPENTAFYEDPADPATIKRLQNMADLDPWFDELCRSDRFLGLASELLGEEAVVRNQQWFNKPARAGAVTPPHQDGFYFMLEPNHAVTLWLALDQIDEENGCIRYVRGSHRLGIRVHQPSDVLGFSLGLPDYGDEDRALETPIHAQPGDLFAHHCMVIHRADANESDRGRSALGLVYYAGSATVDDERAARYREELFARWKREGRL